MSSVHVLLTCVVLLSSVLVCAGPPGLPTFSESLKDPFGSKDALLDIDVQTPCLTLLQLDVHIPTESTNDETHGLFFLQGNAYFDGPDFGWTTVPGITIHTDVSPTSHSSSVQMKWVQSTHTLSFKGFSVDNGVTGTAEATTVKKDPTNWWNLNFDIPSADFPTWVPLTLVPFIDAIEGDDLTIKITAPTSFVATQLEGVCGPQPPCDNPNGCGGSGDPVFSGFQGQTYQFHGLPDEHFNLVSSPDVQLNSHFVYLSSGKCDFNDTECYTHPGTYMDVLGFSIMDTQVKLVAGTHEQGLRVWIDHQEITRGTHIKTLSINTTAQLRYHHNGRVEIHTEIMNFEIANSDMFMNIRVGLNNQQLMRVGATKHSVTDRTICKTNSETHNHQLIEQTVAGKYPVTTPLHGLIGQTWRNVKVCGRDWMGTVQDYLASDLFASDYHYNYFKW
uniref:Uncharacterized protein n=1 Tax=Noccaea caerulescens TaxID=107243 RepID=A0A1J3FH62_NOCCA